MKRPRDVDMTAGNIISHILRFAFPLLLGNIFQQLYNTVDTWVVGNFASNEAYSAVGNVGPIINTLIGIFTGLASGAGVVISQFYGAHRAEDVRKAVHTSIVMTLALALLFTGLGIAIVPFMLDLMNMPESVKPEAATYLTIYFAGIVGLMLYNMGAGILRAVGDSQRPFYYLVACAVINTVLDLLFVLVLDMGVAGVAWATVLSQCISAVLVLIHLMRTHSDIRLELKHLTLHWPTLKKIFSVGTPAALQMAVTSFSNVFIQSYVNFFGAEFMGGWTSFSKIEQFLLLPMSSISLACTTFVGQNLGSGQEARAKKGVSISMALAVGITVALAIPIMVFAEPFVTFFNAAPNVVAYGTMLLHWMTPCYLLVCINSIHTCALRGAGNSKVPMIIQLATYVAFRLVYMEIMSNVCNEIIPIVMAYPAGWLLAVIANGIYYHRVPLSKTRLVEQK